MRRTKDKRDRDKFEHKAKAFRKVERRRYEDRDAELELRQVMGSPGSIHAARPN